jgi:hypothetical protein
MTNMIDSQKSTDWKHKYGRAIKEDNINSFFPDEKETWHGVEVISMLS